MWRSTSSSKRRRLNSPVSASWSAMWRRRSSAAAARRPAARVGHVDAGPDEVGHRPSGPVSAVVDHSISRSSPSRVRQWNSARTGDSPASAPRCRLGDGALRVRDQVEHRSRPAHSAACTRAAARRPGSTARAGPRSPATTISEAAARAPHRAAAGPQRPGSCHAQWVPPIAPIAQVGESHSPVRHTFPHGPASARRAARGGRRARASARARSGSGRRAAPARTRR